MVVHTEFVICRPRYGGPQSLRAVANYANRNHHGSPHDTLNEPGRYRTHSFCWGLIPFQGMFVGWAILSPISKHAGWAPSHVGDQTDGARGWILWVALAIISADSLISVIPVAAEFAEHLNPFKSWTEPSVGQIDNDDAEVEPPTRLVPKVWTVAGVVTSVFGGTFVIWIVFGNEGIRWWATILGFGFGGVLSLLGYETFLTTSSSKLSMKVQSTSPR
jgi:OPT oligopeptide transporter protein